MEQKSGIFLVNKPRGITTNHLIQKIKSRLQIKKIGHAGTLDPLAEGLVVVLVNQATKLSSFLISENKGYRATIKLFSATPTGDEEGVVVQQVTPFIISPSALKEVRRKFHNHQYNQQVPLFSAVKFHGQKLYEYARAETPITPPKRPVTIRNFQINHYDPKSQTLEIDVLVSKGTYIRTLAQDVAQHLGTIGHLHQLIRLQSGNFTLEQAKDWETLEWDDLINLYDTLMMAHYPIFIYQGSFQEIAQGKKISLPSPAPPQVFIADDQKRIWSYYELGQDHFYHCIRGGFNNN